jgi:hypothetical protein
MRTAQKARMQAALQITRELQAAERHLESLKVFQLGNPAPIASRRKPAKSKTARSPSDQKRKRAASSR